MNTNSKHTPGPWHVKASEFDMNGKPVSWDVVDEADKTVAIACAYEPYGPYDGKNEANSNLIAAAPDLLEVARGILADDLLQYLPAEYVAKVRAAIAKAEGRS